MLCPALPSIKNCTELLQAGRCDTGHRSSKLAEHWDASCNPAGYWLMVTDQTSWLFSWENKQTKTTRLRALYFVPCATHPAWDAVNEGSWRNPKRESLYHPWTELCQWLQEVQSLRVDGCLHMVIFSESLLTLEANMSHHSSTESLIRFSWLWGWSSKMWRCRAGDSDTIFRVQQSPSKGEDDFWSWSWHWAPEVLGDFLRNGMCLVLLHSCPL